jgi:hypothetical protein
MTNIYNLIHWTYYLSLGFIFQKQLLGHVFTSIDVLNNVNLDRLLKSNLGYKEWGRIRTFPNHLDCFHKDAFVLIKQLGPPTFFITFTMGVNNWLALIETLKEWHDQQYVTKNK